MIEFPDVSGCSSAPSALSVVYNPLSVPLNHSEQRIDVEVFDGFVNSHDDYEHGSDLVQHGSS